MSDGLKEDNGILRLTHRDAIDGEHGAAISSRASNWPWLNPASPLKGNLSLRL
jgi:hypothetical protein